MMLMGLGLLTGGSGLQQQDPPAGSGISQRGMPSGGSTPGGAGSGVSPSGGGVQTGYPRSSGIRTGLYAPPWPVMYAPGGNEPPPVFHRSDDCLVIIGSGSPIFDPGNPRWVDLISRIQQGLNYIRVMPTPIPITGVWDTFTQVGWTAFWGRYGKWDKFSGKNLRIDPTLSCKGLNELISAVAAQHMASIATTGIDSGIVGRHAGISTGDPSHPGLNFYERDQLWIVVPDDRDWLKSLLRQRLYRSETLSGSATIATAARSSAAIPPGQDAWSKIAQKYNAGYAVMIASHMPLSGDTKILFTKDAATIWKRASERGSGLSNAMQGFGQMPSMSIGTGGGGGVQTGMIIGGHAGGGGGGPDPATGLAPWALIFPGPKALLDAARALASGQLPGGGAGGTIGGGTIGGGGPGGITGGSEQTYPPNCIAGPGGMPIYPDGTPCAPIPGGLPPGYPPGGAPAPAPAAASSATPWLLLGGVAVIGAAAYFLI